MSRRTNYHQYLLPLILLFWLGAGGVQAEDEKTGKEPESKASFAEALKNGKVGLSLRYRFELVDEDRFPDSAEASTLRTALSYRSSEWQGFTLFLEAENVTALFDDDGYNNAGAGSLNNRVRGVPVVADPEGTEINQANLSWRNEKVQVILGRQAINLGDQRFVGAVAWRQNHQSFDALRLKAELSPRLKLDYSFADSVHRIFGDEIAMASHFLNLPIQLAKRHQVTAYGYWLDYEDLSFLSTSTFGLEYIGTLDLNDRLALRLELETASQQDIADNPVEVDTDYHLASLGFRRGAFGIDVTWEVLGDFGDGSRPFQTPLSTLHKWNGWADKFLQTPSPGLETLYLRFKGSLAKDWRFSVTYHDFTSDGGDIDYGTEIDGELVYKAPWKQTFALKLAFYDAERFSTDTEKIMLWSSYSF